MIQNKEAPLKVYGFLVGIELEEGTTPDFISGKLSDAVTWVEGTGRVEVECLGTIEEYIDEEKTDGQIREGLNDSKS